MVDESHIRDRIKELMVEKLGIHGLDPVEIDDDATIDWTDFDSVDALELVVCLQKEFTIKVADEDLNEESFASVAVLAALVEKYVAAREPQET